MDCQVLLNHHIESVSLLLYESQGLSRPCNCGTWEGVDVGQPWSEQEVEEACRLLLLAGGEEELHDDDAQAVADVLTFFDHDDGAGDDDVNDPLVEDGDEDADGVLLVQDRPQNVFHGSYLLKSLVEVN